MSTTSQEERPLLGPKSDSHEQTHRRRVIAVSFTMVLLTDFAAFFLDAPQTSILEGNICSRYYQHTSSPADRDCGAGPVQAELATVNQMLNTFNRLPGLFAAIPFGIIADRYGRRPVFVLTILGALLQDVISKIILWRPDLFAPRLIWLSSLATFVGGGDAVASSMVFLVVADVASPHQRAKLFFLLTACERVGEIVATPLSALLMSIWNPWIPYLLYSVLTLIAGMVPLLFLPETLRRFKPSPGTGQEPDAASCESDPDAGEGPRASADPAPSASTHHTFISKFRPLVKHNVIAVLLAFFVSALGRQSASFLLQYIRQRFNWSYEKASVLLTLRAAVDFALLLVGLPALHKVLVKRDSSSQGKDLFISRISVAFFTLGSLVISLAPIVSLVALGIVIFAFGSGFAPAARSLATTFVHQDEAGLLYTALAITQTSNDTSTGGRIWTEYVQQYTGVRLYDYAVSGAVCDTYFSPSSRNGIKQDQIPYFLNDTDYVGNSSLINPGDETIYAIWIGTNDLGPAAFFTDSRLNLTIVDYIDCVYEQLDALYEVGARNFVLLNIAPLNYALMYALPGNGGTIDSHFWEDESTYNTNATQVSEKMRQYVALVNNIYDYRTPVEVQISDRYADSSFTIFDVHSLLNDIWHNPGAYLNGTAPLNVTSTIDACGSACRNSSIRDSYMWYDTLHPSEQTDRIIAQEFVNIVNGNGTWSKTWISPSA